MSAIRDYLKTLHLFEMTRFLSSEENPSTKAWFHYDSEGRVTGHSFEPADKEWDGTGERPVIVPLGKDGDQAKLSQNWTEFINMAEEEERKQRG
jgi:hypothetical protein